MRQIVMDTETTGFKAGEDKIVSITLLELIDRIPTGAYVSHYVNPGRPSSPGALAVHGLTDDFLATQPSLKAVAESLISFLGEDSWLVGHNLQFDQRFICAELKDAGFHYEAFGKDGVCTLAMARLAKGQGAFGKGNKLDDLVAQFGIADLRKATGQHGSFVDALLTAQVYYALRSGGLNRRILDAIAAIVKSEFDVDLGQQSEISTGLPAAAQADAAAIPADVRSVGGRNAEVIQRPAPVHHAAPSRSTGSGVTAAGSRSGISGPSAVVSAADRLRMVIAGLK